MRYAIQTLGCQMNYSDSERVCRILEDLGYIVTRNEAEADLLIFNTCSIRQKAEDKVTGLVRTWIRLKKDNPNIRIGLTGCMVKTSSTRNSEKKDELLKRLKGLDLVFRIEELSLLPKLLQESHTGLRLNEIDTGSLGNYFNIRPKYTSKFSAYVPVMTGCDNYCSFCIVPFTRGRERSRPLSDIVSEVSRLVSEGRIEITLIGQKVNGYGMSDLDKKGGEFSSFVGHPFAKLLTELNDISGLSRIRFSSSHPDNMTDDLIETIGRLPKVCPYIHLPVQSGDDAVLKRMNRQYTREGYVRILKKFTSVMPSVSFSTDAIVGFCGETEEEFRNTLSLFREVRFDMAYLAQYSPRKGTVSARFYKDDVPPSEKARRFHLLNDLLRSISSENHKSWIDKKVEVLVEKCENGVCTGRTEHYRLIHFPGVAEYVGKILPVDVKDSTDWELFGEICGNLSPSVTAHTRKTISAV